MTERPCLLIVDDQPDALAALRAAFGGEGVDVRVATSLDSAMAAVRAHSPDAALIDLNFAHDQPRGTQGLDLLAQLRECAPDLPVIVMTASATVGLAVEAMRQGARDFIEKPWDIHRLHTVLRHQLELGRALRRSREMEGEGALLRSGAE